MELIEKLTKQHGDKHYQVIKNALMWLDVEEPKWHLSESIDKEEFISNLLQRAQ